MIRVLRGNSAINNGGGNGGWAGRSGDSGQNANSNYDAGLLSHTFTVSPGLNAGQNVKYRLQLGCDKTGSNNTSCSANCGSGTDSFDLAYLSVMEVENDNL